MTAKNLKAELVVIGGGGGAFVVGVVAGASFVTIRRIVRVAPAEVLRDE